MYCPPLTIRVVDCRSFGRFTLVGCQLIWSFILASLNKLTNSKVGTHTSPSIHKFLYTPTVRSQTKQQPGSLRDQQGTSLRNQLNDIADVERRHIMSNLSHQQEMDFRWLSKRSFFDLISQIFSGCLTMGRSHHWSQMGLSSQRKPSSRSTMWDPYHHWNQEKTLTITGHIHPGLPVQGGKRTHEEQWCCWGGQRIIMWTCFRDED